jgi:glycosyltransferase involved in cell wall biosynthesis
MGQGLPILTLDHQGVGTFVPPDAAIKVPVTNPRETVRGIAEGIRWLGRNPEARPRMGEAGHAYAKTQTWEKRAETMSKLYEEVLAHPGCQQAEALCGSKGTAHDPSTSGLNSFPRYYP